MGGVLATDCKNMCSEGAVFAFNTTPNASRRLFFMLNENDEMDKQHVVSRATLHLDFKYIQN